MAGRRSKGDRHAFMTRIPRAAADRVLEDAQRLGISYSDYIAYLVANAVGVETSLPVTPKERQEELPLQTAS
ncbi:hypothetical protein [Nocardioides sp. ChNu-99]|uniref:hypothetical protein n=1 Tax=Nocardioides sp. ChNu-99 TaxID=2839897 RepID=UPI0024068E4C|nr:hypothetical protein [Nocardioides sp. ChNu-99]MDF9716460.1 hypothetical protein [Nocardioides sp. ChNu-99]